MDFLIRMARMVVDQVITLLAQQLNIVETSVHNPMQAIVQSVVGGVWQGQGANAFVDEVSSLVIPGVGVVSSHITRMSDNTQKAREIIDQADGEVEGIVHGQLTDQFRFY
jgi:hypothetical protein